MTRVASLFLPQLPIERLRSAERPRALPEAARPALPPIDDDPGACSVPRGGHWRPGARWANSAEARARIAIEAEALPSHQRPSIREMGRRSEAAPHPFRAMSASESSREQDTGTRAAADMRLAPLVVVATSGQREIVTAASREALALGLHPGMAATQARAFVAGLDVRPADRQADIAVLQRLALHAARHWTPVAEVSEPDGLVLELTGSTHLFGGEACFCRRLVAFCGRAGFTARVAIAGNVGAAHALARYARTSIVIVPAGSEAQAIAELPLAALRLTDDALSTASHFGLDRIADLIAMPRGPLAKRLGRETLHRLDQALGRSAEPITGIVPFEPPAVVRRLMEPIGTADSIALVIGDLVADLVAALRASGLGARSLDLVLLRIDGTEQRIAFGTARATRDAPHLERLLGLRIDRIDPGAGIEEMRLTATRAEPLAAMPIEGALVPDASSSDVAGLVDILAGRIGGSRLFKLCSVESDVPERAVRPVPPLQKAEGWNGWRRPARLLRRPEPLDNVVALLPDHPPRRFTWRGIAHGVVAGDGPERVFGEWWRRDGEIWAVRDYYCVEDERGSRFWIFRRGDGVDAATGDLSWHIHGVFG
jgi:protein ImuB